MKSRLEILSSLLKELSEGKAEKEVRKEFEDAFGKKALDKLVDPRKEGAKRFSENPLRLMAEENGALKALRQSLEKDFFSPHDNIRSSRLKDELSRLSSLSLHYDKVKELLFPLLPDLPKEGKEERRKDEKDALFLVKTRKAAIEERDEGKRKETLPLLLQALDRNRKNENGYLLPLLDERLSDDSLFLLKKRRDERGYFLIRYP